MEKLLANIRACRICEGLPLGPRPLVQANASARILIAGQAPGRLAHAKGIPFDDASGNRLRDWLGLDRAQFYCAQKVAIAPMGFCFPGAGKSGDLPPRAECAPQWRAQLLAAMPALELVLIIGRYAVAWHLPQMKGLPLAELVRDKVAPHAQVLPHPSPRNNRWLKQNPWFEARILPQLRSRIAEVMA
ncbi:uracil-DNA glycosylase family protein [Pseudorhodobacter sp.]|uniref:uracil-DNA glycosylase family protein n=1 Tax=Pseudorhodobacter sp. TaxID=1934400 RepID=UPI002AFDE95B|nr:uracil-DNA glycosylase family protein [Pseudorhodobacter sp.]